MEVKSKPSKDLVYKHIQRYYKASIEENVKVKVMNNTTYYGDKSRNRSRFEDIRLCVFSWSIWL